GKNCLELVAVTLPKNTNRISQLCTVSFLPSRKTPILWIMPFYFTTLLLFLNSKKTKSPVFMYHFVTIKDIARELNISVSTVSRALRDTFDVSPKTRKKVLKKAKELGYQPNLNARGLSQGKTNN